MDLQLKGKTARGSISRAGVVSRAAGALVAGSIAVLLNTLALDAARIVPVATGNGGLLRFLVMLSGGALSTPAGAAFQNGFHIVTGLAMAFFYAFVLEPWIRLPSWLRGVLFATAVWLVNAIIVLPAIGEGIAGNHDLPLAGLVWFAAAHTLFFLVLAILFDRLHPALAAKRTGFQLFRKRTEQNHLLAFVVFAFAIANPAARAQQSEGVPVHVVVTVEARKGQEMPVINREDVMVREGRDRDEVIDWVPAQGDHSSLELMILLDDGSNTTLGTQLDDIRNFINSQPDTTMVGVAYMRDGVAQVVQNLTRDHALAAKALRLPVGLRGVNGSPYFSLTDLVKRWPATTARRTVVMATDGIDRNYGTGDLQNPYLDEVIDNAGITVSTIYTPGVGHFGHSYWQSYWGQIYLSRLAEETGGEAYYIGFTGPPVSFTPFLDDVGKRLSHQYLLTFLAKPPKKANWQRIRLMTEVPNADLVAPGKVWVTP